MLELNETSIVSILLWEIVKKKSKFIPISFQDLQFSTDDEEFEEVVGEFESVAETLGQGEALARSSQPVNYLQGTFSYT